MPQSCYFAENRPLALNFIPIPAEYFPSGVAFSGFASEWNTCFELAEGRKNK